VCRESCGNCTQRDVVEEARGARVPIAGSAGSSADTGEPGRAGRAAARHDAPLREMARSDAVPTHDGDATAADAELFERLRALRKRLADERKVPAYVVFSDRTLQAMAAQKPCTADGLLDIHGVGQKKLDEYGEAFLAEIAGPG
jgi:ATP-dependent DNA helicase RecQ